MQKKNEQEVYLICTHFSLYFILPYITIQVDDWSHCDIFVKSEVGIWRCNEVLSSSVTNCRQWHWIFYMRLVLLYSYWKLHICRSCSSVSVPALTSTAFVTYQLLLHTMETWNYVKCKRDTSNKMLFNKIGEKCRRCSRLTKEMTRNCVHEENIPIASQSAFQIQTPNHLSEI